MKSFCISHRKDVDGLGSGALAVAATGGKIILSDYDELIDNLKRIPDDADGLVVTDLGAHNSNFEEYLVQMKRIAKHARVTHIDHHYMPEEAKRRVRRAGVRLVHDTTECASVLTYMTFKDVLPEGARLIALYGAVTDYMDDSPIAARLMEQRDRHFVLLEATMLSYAVGGMEGKEDFPELVVKELAKMRHPHEIEGVPEAALGELDEVSKLGEQVKSLGKKKGRLAYMVTTKYSTGQIAKLLIGAFEVPVGVAMKEKQERWYEVSLRSTSEAKIHLGRVIAKITERLGGSGGGHRKAAGGRVPASRVDEMLDDLAKEV
jgi:RecJ-like exonuclease